MRKNCSHPNIEERKRPGKWCPMLMPMPISGRSCACVRARGRQKFYISYLPLFSFHVPLRFKMFHATKREMEVMNTGLLPHRPPADQERGLYLLPLLLLLLHSGCRYAHLFLALLPSSISFHIHFFIGRCSGSTYRFKTQASTP